MLALLWMLGWCAALCAPARAGVETWEAGGLRLVGSEDWLSALDPRDCGVVWNRPLRGAGEMSLVPGNDEVWLAVGLDRLEAFDPATGRPRWRRDGMDLAWGPEVLGPGVLLAERGRAGLSLVCRDLADGTAVWREPLGMDLVSARDWEGDLLLRLKSFPPTRTTSKYLRASGTPPSAPPGPERLALLSGQDGTLVGRRFGEAPPADPGSSVRWPCPSRPAPRDAVWWLGAGLCQTVWTLPLEGPWLGSPCRWVSPCFWRSRPPGRSEWPGWNRPPAGSHGSLGLPGRRRWRPSSRLVGFTSSALNPIPRRPRKSPA